MPKLVKHKHKRNVFSFKFLRTIPTFLVTNSTTLVLVFVDGVISGNFIGQDALIGISIASPLLFICGAAVSIVSRGSSVPLSKALGKIDKDQERSICRTASVMTLILMMIFVFLQPCIVSIIMQGYDQETAIAQACNGYCQGVFIANIAGVISTVGVYVLIAYGKAKTIFKMAVVEVICNAVFDVLFVCVLNMGAFGAGLGTSMANLVRMSITLYFLQKEIKFFNKIILKSNLQFVTVIKYGLPTFVFMILPPITLILINYVILIALGEEGLLAKSLGAYAFQLTSIITGSVTSSLTPLLGLSKGTNDSIGEKRLMRLALGVTFAMSSLITLILCLWPQLLFLVFGAKETNEFVFFLFRFMALSCIVSALNDVLSSYMIFSEKKLFATIVDCLCSVFILFLSMIALSYIDTSLIFLSYFIAYGIKFILYYVVYKKILCHSHPSEILYYSFHDTENIRNDSNKYLDLLQETLTKLNFKKKFVLHARLLAEEVIFFNRFIEDKSKFLVRFGIVIFEDKILFYSIDNGQKWTGLINEHTEKYITDNYIVAQHLSDIFNYSYFLDLNYFTYSKDYSKIDTNFSDTDFKARSYRSFLRALS